MHQSLLDLLRCPYCGTRLSVVENGALDRTGDRIDAGVLGCECCAYPVVAGIPVLIADGVTREAMHLLEAGEPDASLFRLLGIDGAREEAFRELLGRGDEATYRDALALLCRDAEATCFLYRFSDPTYVTIEALLQAVGGCPTATASRALDLCGGTGHVTRVLQGLEPSGGTVLADVYFWKLWLAKRFNAPGCETICCDANHPLPFVRGAFSLTVLADAFPYIWHKRLLADEMTRVAAADGVIVMPHLHSARGNNFSAGSTLTPEAHRDLFASRLPRLFRDTQLFDAAVEGRAIDLTRDATPAEIGDDPSFTLIAGPPDLFRVHELPTVPRVVGKLRVNPLYRVGRQGGACMLTLTFPTPEYEEEFGDCRRYLPQRVIVDADVTGAIGPEQLGPRIDELRRRRVIIDAPPRYC